MSGPDTQRMAPVVDPKVEGVAQEDESKRELESTMEVCDDSECGNDEKEDGGNDDVSFHSRCGASIFAGCTRSGLNKVLEEMKEALEEKENKIKQLEVGVRRSASAPQCG
eukprot:851947-Rhodomonas_salina.4